MQMPQNNHGFHKNQQQILYSQLPPSQPSSHNNLPMTSSNVPPPSNLNQLAQGMHQAVNKSLGSVNHVSHNRNSMRMYQKERGNPSIGSHYDTQENVNRGSEAITTQSTRSAFVMKHGHNARVVLSTKPSSH